MNNNRIIRSIAIAALCISIVGLSIGFAALSREINVTGVGTVKGNIFEVEFTNITAPTATSLGSEVTATIDSAATITGTPAHTLTFAVSLKLPGDKVVYTATITNTGTVDARFKDIVFTGLPAALAEKVNFTVTNTNGSILAVNEVLLAANSATSTLAGTKDVLITIELDPAKDDLPTVDVPLSLGATLEYVPN